jgi:hypothetical protein
MLPGQEPYNADELRRLHEAVRDAADDDPGEDDEGEVEPRTDAVGAREVYVRDWASSRALHR